MRLIIGSIGVFHIYLHVIIDFLLPGAHSSADPKSEKGGRTGKHFSHFSKISFLDQQDTSSFDIVKATQYGAFDRVQEIIESGFDVNERDEVNKIVKSTNQWATIVKIITFSLKENVTLLHWASINNRREIVQYFLQLGADCNAVGGELMSTPLHWATR